MIECLFTTLSELQNNRKSNTIDLKTKKKQKKIHKQNTALSTIASTIINRTIHRVQPRRLQLLKQSLRTTTCSYLMRAEHLRVDLPRLPPTTI